MCNERYYFRITLLFYYLPCQIKWFNLFKLRMNDAFNICLNVTVIILSSYPSRRLKMCLLQKSAGGMSNIEFLVFRKIGRSVPNKTVISK